MDHRLDTLARFLLKVYSPNQYDLIELILKGQYQRSYM